MEPEAIVAATGVAGSVLGYVGKWTLDRYLKKRAAEEDARDAEILALKAKQEADRDAQLTKILAASEKTAHELGRLTERTEQQNLTLTSLSSRLEGVAADYKPRLSALETFMTETRTRWAMEAEERRLEVMRESTSGRGATVVSTSGGTR